MSNELLDGISIASPCSADWNRMQGDERRRFCASCKLHVHDLSGMTAAEATALLQQAGGGRVCVRFFRRADGTVLTRDCPVGLRQKLRRAWARAAALWLALWGGATACVRAPVAGEQPAVPPVGATPPLGTTPLMGTPAPQALQGEVVMGDVLVPSPPEPAPKPLMGKIRAPESPPKK
ncbi:MAG TPA: hypothetical protein VFZ65_00250 [Planctomycetota bacterium]|nr:hypothetical protein [Planctomycetota bacterium]